MYTKGVTRNGKPFYECPSWVHGLVLARGQGVWSDMRTRTNLYIAFVASLALGSEAGLYLSAPVLVPGALTAVLVLAALAIAAEALSFLLPKSATASLVFIPFFASALLVPAWPTVAVIIVETFIVHLTLRRQKRKSIFNVFQRALSVGAAIWIYRSLGGVGLLGLGGDTLSPVHLTAHVGIAALIACALALMLNNMLVSGVIAISANSSPWQVWRENNRVTAGADLLASPLIFVFAWVDARFGPIAASALWVPILGLRQVHSTNLELEQTNRELLELMVKSLEARDSYTSGHSRRVRDYSLLIARAIGLSEIEVEQVGRAALLHDVGKIHEKYAAVLAKTDKLSADEWALIKEHPVDGANLVATMSKLRDMVPAIRHHHERWDGTGYPDGLAGELIPLASRIITFADTIDAMVTERPYRRPLGEAAVRAEIVRCRGAQFDPAIADKLLSSTLWQSLFPPRQEDEPEAVAGGELPGSTSRAGLRVVV